MMRYLVLGALVGFGVAVLLVSALGTPSSAPVAAPIDAGASAPLPGLPVRPRQVMMGLLKKPELLLVRSDAGVSNPP